MTGDQGNTWKKGTANIGLQGDFFIAIEAIMKSGYKGDISLDDIEFINCAIGEDSEDFVICIIVKMMVSFFFRGLI